jgi:hypothetical protein
MVSYVGIDYGLGKTNIDKETGIRFGVINQNRVLQAWHDNSEPYYGSAADCEFECPKCCIIAVNLNGLDWGDTLTCAECNREFEAEIPDCAEAVSFFIDDIEYKAECESDGDIFVMQSPYYTYAQFCSPCAPGACYLMNPVEPSHGNNRCYCFGHDWFDEGKAPYPVYSVETNKLVEPE